MTINNSTSQARAKIQPTNEMKDNINKLFNKIKRSFNELSFDEQRKVNCGLRIERDYLCEEIASGKGLGAKIAREWSPRFNRPLSDKQIWAMAFTLEEVRSKKSEVDLIELARYFCGNCEFDDTIREQMEVDGYTAEQIEEVVKLAKKMFDEQ